MTVAAAEVAASSGRRPGQLALLLQELLTATVRLRDNPGDVPPDVDAFRAQVRRLISVANQEGRRLGYDETDLGYALYAVVTFLDETVLTQGHVAFRSWQGRPLQEEVFGVNVGGDVFFEYLDALLTRQDSESLADVLEVFQLCLLLGFRGRYGGSQGETIHTWTSRVRDRITRIRGAPPPFAPNWAPVGTETLSRARDPLQRNLLLALSILMSVALVLFIVFRLWLAAESRDIGALASP